MAGPPFRPRRAFLLAKVSAPVRLFHLDDERTLFFLPFHYYTLIIIKTMAVAQIKLNTGASIPQIGFGTWQAEPGQVGTAVAEALKAGYRHLDLAKVYQNQKEVAKAIKASNVPRSELFITSKLWCNSFKPEHVEEALDDTLAELELEYLDLYLLHWPVAFKGEGDRSKNLFPDGGVGPDGVPQVATDPSIKYTDTYKAAIKLIDTGKVRAVGVSNLGTKLVDTIIEKTGFVPAVNQIERHPLLIQQELVDHHKKLGIHITAYSPLGNNNVGAKKLFEYPEVIALAERKGVTPAQVLIAWGAVGGHSVIPKSVTPSRVASNFVQVTLTDDEYKEISKLGEKPHRFNIPYNYRPRFNVNIFNTPDEKDAAYTVTE